jgi:AMP nucleosidase
MDHQTQTFTNADQALARVMELYNHAVAGLDARFQAFAAGDHETPAPDACYPYVAIETDGAARLPGPHLSYGVVTSAGRYATTLTRPKLYATYLREQFGLLLRHYDVPLEIGVSDRTIPLPFAVEEAADGITHDHVETLQRIFTLPRIGQIDDTIANGRHQRLPGAPKPLSLFPAERIDYSLVRLSHYTATAPEHFQHFVLFTNYQRYVDEFVALGRAAVTETNEWTAFVEPGDVETLPDGSSSGTAPANLPQMPAYHLKRADNHGITLINIGVGPSNAKTITDHLAVLRPHCWLMIGHCGSLRSTQQLGDYVLAHAYVRADQVLEADLPAWMPVPPIAEVQQALHAAVSNITGLAGQERKARLRTGTIFTTDDRDWELRLVEIRPAFNQSRAIAIDMESATIAANGFRFRVPYGTLLCVSDKPLHGEIKLRGMANAFYRERISQHLTIALETVERLREAGVDTLHSRKLRSLDEPAFR